MGSEGAAGGSARAGISFFGVGADGGFSSIGGAAKRRPTANPAGITRSVIVRRREASGAQVRMMPYLSVGLEAVASPDRTP